MLHIDYGSFVLFCFVGLGLELRAYLELLHQPFFVKGFFQIRSCRTIFLGWLQTVILLISAS
jgi:hypothetical protein